MAQNRENSVGIVKPQTMRVVEEENPLELACGKYISPVDIAYETYGHLNESCDNAILICHALSGNAHAAGYHSQDDKRPGWWEVMVGPGKMIDTDRYFVVCSNFIGGCSGTTGPGSINPATGSPYGLDFPMVTIADMVRVQKLLLDRLGIKQLLSVIGGSMGGMQVLQWAIEFPEFVRSAIAVATTSHLNAQSIAFDTVGRSAILADPNFAAGRYTSQTPPDRGLGIARMIGHITYLSEQSMREKFGRQLRGADSYRYDFDSQFAVETYLDYQGKSFVERFDANSYLYITRAMDYFDLKKQYGSLQEAFASVRCRFLIVSFSSDWLFTPEQSRDMVDALVAGDKNVSFCNIDSPYGHDSFLLESGTLGLFISGFLEAAHRLSVPADAEMPGGVSSVDPDGAWARRVDYELIESLVEPGSTVLDVGCGDGALLARLTVDRNIKGRGIELDQNQVLKCIKRGLSVIQQDVEQGLANYADKSFDVVTLSQTVQTIKNPIKVFSELLRVGRKVIVSFPNFAHWRCRAQLLFKGRAPITPQLPFEWHNSPNIHLLSIKDFDRFCESLGVRVEKRIPLIKTSVSPVRFAPNLFAEQVIYVTSLPA